MSNENNQTSDELKIGDAVEPIEEGWNDIFTVKKILTEFTCAPKSTRSVVFKEGGFMPMFLLRKVVNK